MSGKFEEFLEQNGTYLCPFSKKPRILSNDTWVEGYEGENWKSFHNFELSDMGRFKKNGVIRKIYCEKIARAAYYLFKGINNNSLFLEHINGVETDNRVSNLRLVEKLCERFMIYGYNEEGEEKYSYSINNLIGEFGMEIINYINKPLKYMGYYWIRKIHNGVDKNFKLKSFKIDGVTIKFDYDKKIVIYPNSMLCHDSDKIVINHKRYSLTEINNKINSRSQDYLINSMPLMKIVDKENNDEIYTKCLEKMVKFTGLPNNEIVKIIMNNESHDKFTFTKIRNNKRKLNE